MRTIGLQARIALCVVAPATVLIAIVCLSPLHGSLRWISLLCGSWLLGGCASIYLILLPRLRRVRENAYRYANGLPGRQIGGPQDDIYEIDDIVRKVYTSLDAATNKYKVCLSNSVDVICALRSDLKFSMASEAARRLWQHDPYHLVGRALTEFVHPEDAAAVSAAAQSAVDSGAPVSINARVVRRDGSLCWTAWAFSWVPSEASYFCISKDITAQHEAEQMKRQFLNMISHDLRTPLMSLNAFMEVLSAGRYGDLNDRGIEMSRNNRSSVTRLIRLVNDLLDLEKMDEGKFELELTQMPISEVVADAVLSIESYANQKGIHIERSGDPDLELEVDPQRMVQVVQNLVSNAVKFSPSGTKVSISWERDGNELVLRVDDEGSGIAKDKAEYIFDRFRQVRNSEGSGLGLAICQAIVAQHRGMIGVEQRSPKGSSFWIRLPFTADISLMVRT